MNLKEFVLQNEDGTISNYEVVTIINIEKFSSLYLVYRSRNQLDEVLIARLNISEDKIYLENIENDDEIKEIDNKLSERGIK